MTSTKRTYHKKAYLRKGANAKPLILVKFPFDRETVAQVKSIEGRKYNPDKQCWFVPATKTSLYKLIEFNFQLDETLTASYKKILEKPPDKPTKMEEYVLSNPNPDYILRPYQVKATAAALEFLMKPKSKDNAVLVLPTGAGKSLIVASIAANIDQNVLVLQPSKELLEQNYGKFVSYGYTAGVFSASLNTKEVKPVTFATIGSVVNAVDLFTNFPIIIIDECHLVVPEPGSQYQTFLTQISAKVIGLTATPIRMKRYNFPEPHAKICMLDRMRPRFFNKYIHITQISEMATAGYFAKIDYRDLTKRTDMLKLNTTGADYTLDSLRKWWRDNGTDSTIEQISRLKEHRHILVFVPDVQYAYFLKDKIPNSAVIESGTHKKDRRKILELFKAGKIRVVLNVNVLTIGFDFPALDCIILARPTRSLGLYYQMIGRGVRPAPGKDKTVVYDLSECLKRFGKVEDLKMERVEGFWCLTSGGKILTNVSISEYRK